MSDTTQQDGEQRVMERIAKLLALAEKNPNKEEAAAALAKAHEWMAAWNIDMVTIEQNTGVSGKRLDDRVTGGAYKYQQRLWTAIAELNFCMYWTMKVRTKENTYQYRRGRKWTHEHRLVGRQVNVIGTRNMANYLEATINRMCIDRLGEEGDAKTFYSSWAMAYREGISDVVIDKILERRKDIKSQEEAKARKAAAAAERAGVSVATAMTIASIEDREEQANYDFLHGEGAWAKKLAAEEEWQKGWAKRREARAKAQAEAEAAYAAWAVANPEEAAKEAAKERAKQRAADKRAANRRYSYRDRQETAAERRRESGAYYSGRDAGRNVSIDQQTDGESKSRKRIANG